MASQVKNPSYSILKRLLSLSGVNRKRLYIQMFVGEMGKGLKEGRYIDHVELIQEIHPKLDGLLERCKDECGEYLNVTINSELLWDIGQAMKQMEEAEKEPRKPGQTSFELQCLNGLECIQDDAHLEPEEGLNGPGLTPYDVITNLILEKLESGDLIWRKSWLDQEPAMNFVSGKMYKGINAITLNFLALKESPYWLTFNQVEAKGGKVRKGAIPWPIVYYRMIYKDSETQKELTSEQVAGMDKSQYITIPIIRYYNLFSAVDVEGIDFPDVPKRVVDPLPAASAIVDGMPNAPKIKNGGNSASYSSVQDLVRMPYQKYFDSDQEYYGTLFHELVHSTGHKKRLSRKLGNPKGSREYAYEELIAEMGAAFLCGESGILYHTMNNSAAYVKGWASRLTEIVKKDNRFILRAAAQAQKAADYILGEQKPKAKQPKQDRKPVPKAKQKSNKGQLSLGLNGLPDHLAKLVSPMGNTDAEVSHEAFTGPGDLIKFMGRLEKKPRGSIAVTLDAPEFSGKTRMFFQAMDAYATAGDNCLFLSLELARESDVFKRLRNQYVSKDNMDNRILVLHEEDITSFEQLLELIEYFDHIFIDSLGKLKKLFPWSDDIDEFRQRADGKVIWAIVQRNHDDTMKGGSGTKYDADVVLKMIVFEDYNESFVYHHKNRYLLDEFTVGTSGVRYSIAKSKILKNEPISA